MAKKKNQSKKHKFKYTDPAAATMADPASAGDATTAAAGSAPARARQAVAVGPTRDFNYVGGDLRRILILAVALVGIELVLWFLFTHTGVGNQVYSLVKV